MMNGKTRRLLWLAPLLGAVAAVAALAVLVAPARPAQAHDLPGAVMNLTASPVDANQMQVSWNAPTSGGMPTGYRIDRSMDGNVWMSLAMDHPDVTYRDRGLMPSTGYYYRVFAVNDAGVGAVSQDYTAQTPAATMPGLVLEVTATPRGQNQIDLAWSAPANTGGTPITAYFIHWAAGTGDMPPAGQDPFNIPGPQGRGIIEVPASAGMALEHTMLTAGTPYRYIVYASNAVGRATAESDLVLAVTEPLDLPLAPPGLSAVQTAVPTFNPDGTVATTAVFNLYWFESPDGGGVSDIQYEVWASYGGASFVSITPTTALGLDQMVLSDNAAVSRNAQHTLPDSAATASTVQYRIYAATSLGDPDDELKSARFAQTPVIRILTDEATMMKTVPAAPNFVQGTGATRDFFGNVSLNWTAPAHGTDALPSSIGGYRIDVSDDGVNWRALVTHTGRTTTQYHYVDEQIVTRLYRIFAWHAQHLGPAQEDPVLSEEEDGGPDDPNQVENFRATAVSSDSITLSWDAPMDDGGAPIIGYRVDGVRQTPNQVTFPAFCTPDDTNPLYLSTNSCTENAGRFWDAAMTTSYTHDDLNGGETWRFRVLPVTDSMQEGSNPLFAPVAGALIKTVTTSPPLPAEAPEGLVAEDAKDSNLSGVADRGVLLLWNAPEAGAGGAVDGYRIQRMSDGGAWETIVDDTETIHTDYTDTDEPAAGELRAYRVAALDGSIVGMYTDPVYYPHALAMHNTPPMVGTAIANQTVMVGSTVMVPSTITDPDMGDMLEWSVMSDMDAVATAMVDDMGMVTVTGMMEGMATITVTAMDSSGESAMQSFMVTVEAAQLTAPTNVATMVNGADVTITWTNGMGAAQHAVILFDADFNFGDRIAGGQNDGMHTFQNVPSGTYTAVVVALDAEYEMELAFEVVTVP